MFTPPSMKMRSFSYHVRLCCGLSSSKLGVDLCLWQMSPPDPVSLRFPSILDATFCLYIQSRPRKVTPEKVVSKQQLLQGKFSTANDKTKSMVELNISSFLEFPLICKPRYFLVLKKNHIL